MTFVARRYSQGDTYEARSEFVSVAYVQALGDGRAFISAFLNDSGVESLIPRSEWLALRDVLSAQGLNLVESERHGRPRVHPQSAVPP